MTDQKPMWTWCLGWFSVMWVTKLMISPVKKRIFCPKMTKFGPKLAFLVNLGQAMQAYSVHCWWVGWWLWRAGCISQDTYLLYVNLIFVKWVEWIFMLPFWIFPWARWMDFHVAPLNISSCIADDFPGQGYGKMIRGTKSEIASTASVSIS